MLNHTIFKYISREPLSTSFGKHSLITNTFNGNPHLPIGVSLKHG